MAFTNEREAALVQQLAAQARTRRITQAQIAAHVGVGREAVSGWFNGHHPMPLPALLGACELMGLELSELIRLAHAQAGEEF